MIVRFSDCYRKFPSRPSDAFPGRSSVSRPVIPVTLINKDDTNKKINYLSLIDSGSDVCLFFADIGEAIGLNVNSGKELQIRGVNNQPITAYFQDIILNIGGYEFICYAGFSRQLPHLNYGVLGQTGFFDRCKIKFDYQSQNIELNLSIP
jgi:hypothetical protein